ERVLVYLTVGKRQGARFSVGDHDDLAHVFLLREQQSSRELQAFGGIRVVRSDLRRGQRGQRNLLGRVVEEHDLERVAGKLRANEMRQRERDFLGGGEA